MLPCYMSRTESQFSVECYIYTKASLPAFTSLPILTAAFFHTLSVPYVPLYRSMSAYFRCITLQLIPRFRRNHALITSLPKPIITLYLPTLHVSGQLKSWARSAELMDTAISQVSRRCSPVMCELATCTERVQRHVASHPSLTITSLTIASTIIISLTFAFITITSSLSHLLLSHPLLLMPYLRIHHYRAYPIVSYHRIYRIPYLRIHHYRAHPIASLTTVSVTIIPLTIISILSHSSHRVVLRRILSYRRTYLLTI